MRSTECFKAWHLTASALLHVWLQAIFQVPVQGRQALLGQVLIIIAQRQACFMVITQQACCNLLWNEPAMCLHIKAQQPWLSVGDYS